MENRMRPIHPGEILNEEFLIPLGMSPTYLARQLRTPTNRITQIINGQRSVSGDTALRLSRFFGNSPEFWMNIQTTYDLRKAQQALGNKQLEQITPLASKLS